MTSVCFTGHRYIKENKENLRRRLLRCIEKTIKEYGIKDFYAGGAIGFDEMASKAVISLQRKYSEIRLHLILPCSFDEFTIKWTEKQKTQLRNIISSAYSVEYISDKYIDGCMKSRNQMLVDLADGLCICYYNPNDRRSGTGQTVRMSEKKKLRIINLFKRK